jgi:hypothetical protein
LQERQEYWKQASKSIENWQGSWLWQWCAFKRNFVSFNNEVI